MLTTSADDCVTLHYQPLARGQHEVVGFESLIRWHHRQRGAISPEAFIPVFEQSGLILPLSRWALHEACREAASWRRPLAVTVNLSAAQFQNEDLPALVEQALLDTGLAPGRLDLELTEAALAFDPTAALATLSVLHSFGVVLTLDEFGTGTALPELLKHYPFSKLKIARSVVQNIETSIAARSIIRMVIGIGRARQIVVAAKGVETAWQFTYLVDEGCDEIQGFLIGRPGPIDSFVELTGGHVESPLVVQWQERDVLPHTMAPRNQQIEAMQPCA